MKIRGSYRQTFTTGAVTTITAGTATAGHILALRNRQRDTIVILRALEVEFLLTTAFGSAQEVGFDLVVARDYLASHSGATALTIGDHSGKRSRELEQPATLIGRIADTGALTAGTHTLDANAICRGGVYCSAVGATLITRRYDFTGDAPVAGLSDVYGDLTKLGGVWLQANEGVVGRNTITMGASGVGKWHFTPEWVEITI